MMTQPPDKFDFEYFEGMEVDRKAAVEEYTKRFPTGLPSSEAVNAARSAAAQEYLNKKFPAGTPASAAISAIEAAGAECKFAHQKPQGEMPSGDYFRCKYTRPGHGLMAFISTIGWTVTVFMDADGHSIKNIWVGRGSTGS